MPAAAVVTIIAAVVVVLVLAGFLLTIARVLVHVNRQVEAIIAAVGTIATETKPVNPAVRSIDDNLGAARDVLTSLLESKVGADGAAQLVASVDPLAEAPPPGDTRDDPTHIQLGNDPARIQPGVDPTHIQLGNDPARIQPGGGPAPGAVEAEPASDEPEITADRGLDRSQRPFPGGGGGEIRFRDRQ